LFERAISIKHAVIKFYKFVELNRAHCNLMAEMEDPDQACFMGTHEIHGKYTKTRVYKRVKLYL